MNSCSSFQYSKAVSYLAAFLFSNNYKPIKATSVAKSMLKYSKIKPLGNHLIYNREMIKD